MKKISLIISGVLFATSSLAHQVIGEYHSSSWNWDNGSHFVQNIAKTTSDTTASATTQKTTQTSNNTQMHTKSMNEGVRDISKTQHTTNVVAKPIFDTGMRPSRSK